jgi:hypothetical protein
MDGLCFIWRIKTSCLHIRLFWNGELLDGWVSIFFILNIYLFFYFLNLSQDCCLIINDAKDVILNRRRSYLVETPYGLFWVKLSVEQRYRIRTSVFMVYDQQDSEDFYIGNGPSGMVFRVSWSDEEGKCRTRSRVRRIIWSPSPLYENINETYTKVRCKKGSLQIDWYHRGNAIRRNHYFMSKTAKIVVANSLRAWSHTHIYIYMYLCICMKNKHCIYKIFEYINICILLLS